DEGGFRWWQWFGVEPAAVGKRRWCWLCSGGAGGGEAADWSRWRCGVGSVGGGVGCGSPDVAGKVAARDGECHSRLDRSGNREHIWVRRKKSAEKVSGSGGGWPAVVAAGGC
nr:hypothetical protein [Tanacetum cinerariifolium]